MGVDIEFIINLREMTFIFLVENCKAINSFSDISIHPQGNLWTYSVRNPRSASKRSALVINRAIGSNLDLPVIPRALLITSALRLLALRGLRTLYVQSRPAGAWRYQRNC